MPSYRSTLCLSRSLSLSLPNNSLLQHRPLANHLFISNLLCERLSPRHEQKLVYHKHHNIIDVCIHQYIVDKRIRAVYSIFWYTRKYCISQMIKIYLYVNVNVLIILFNTLSLFHGYCSCFYYF